MGLYTHEDRAKDELVLAARIAAFRKRWQPTGVDAVYHAQDFERDLYALLQTVSHTARAPIIGQMAAAMACIPLRPIFYEKKETQP